MVGKGGREGGREGETEGEREGKGEGKGGGAGGGGEGHLTALSPKLWATPMRRGSRGAAEALRQDGPSKRSLLDEAIPGPGAFPVPPLRNDAYAREQDHRRLRLSAARRANARARAWHAAQKHTPGQARTQAQTCAPARVQERARTQARAHPQTRTLARVQKGARAHTHTREAKTATRRPNSVEGYRSP